jgi:hypothetical protein
MLKGCEGIVELVRHRHGPVRRRLWPLRLLCHFAPATPGYTPAMPEPKLIPRLPDPVTYIGTSGRGGSAGPQNHRQAISDGTEWEALPASSEMMAACFQSLRQ